MVDPPPIGGDGSLGRGSLGGGGGGHGGDVDCPAGRVGLGLGSSLGALGGHGVLAERVARGKGNAREEEEDWRRKGK